MANRPVVDTKFRTNYWDNANMVSFVFPPTLVYGPLDLGFLCRLAAKIIAFWYKW